MERQPTRNDYDNEADERWLNEGGHILNEKEDSAPLDSSSVESPTTVETDQS